jgi:hypothetical protein
MPPILLPVLPDRHEPDPEVAWIIAALDEWRQRSERSRRDPGRFHPSDLAQSDDEIVARFRGEQIIFTEPAQKLRIFDNGHSMHRRWGSYFRRAGLSVKHKKGFWLPRLRLKGTCDEIIAHPETGETIVVELKSINPFGFTNLWEPHAAHLDQVHCYMAGLRILNGALLYECKGTQAVRVFSARFDEERWRGIEERLMRLRKEAEAQGLSRDEQWAAGQPAAVADAARALRDELASPQDIRDHPGLKVATLS